MAKVSYPFLLCQDPDHLRESDFIGVMRCDLFIPADCNFHSLVLVGQIVLYLFFQLRHRLIGFQVPSNLKIIGDLRLIVGEKETTAG